MLRNSFIHASGIGHRTERWLWENGVRHWDDLDSPSGLPRMGPGLRRRLFESIISGRGALDTGDSAFFQRRLPSRERWRIYGEFHDRVRFLDIETDGLSYGSAITVIGVSDGRRSRAFVAGRDLREFVRAMEGAALLVTFNGKAFDVPFIRRDFPDAPMPGAHIDLMHLFRSLGMRGGLKSVEKQVGLHRGGLDGVDGSFAVSLWARHRAGDPRALPALTRYNLADVVNLRYLIEWAYNRCLERSRGPGRPFALDRPEPEEIDEQSRVILGELGLRPADPDPAAAAASGQDGEDPGLAAGSAADLHRGDDQH